MKTIKPVYHEHFHMSMDKDMAMAISRSGKPAQEWLREAAQMRLNKEQDQALPLERVEQLLKIVLKHIDDLTSELQNVKSELGKGHGVLISAVKQLIEYTQDANHQGAAVRKNQYELSRLMTDMDKNIGHAMEKLGPTLLVVLSQQLRDLIQVEMVKHKEKESKHDPRFPIPDRGLYPGRNL